MTVKAVLVYPKKELREVAQVVAESELNSEEVVNLCQDLKDTMAAYEADGVAATQIGVLKRVIVIKENDQPLIIINPEIVDSSGVLQSSEGCLSFPNVHEVVERSKSVTVRGVMETGIKAVWQFEDRDAVAVQHEIDHLNGVLFIDKVSPLKRRYMLKKLEKTKKKFFIR